MNIKTQTSVNSELGYIIKHTVFGSGLEKDDKGSVHRLWKAKRKDGVRAGTREETWPRIHLTATETGARKITADQEDQNMPHSQTYHLLKVINLYKLYIYKNQRKNKEEKKKHPV